jgi:hypothetical protein
MAMNWRGKLLVMVAGIAVATWPMGLGLLNARLGLAQTLGTGSPQAFDVASVKVDRSFSDSSSTSFGPGGSFTARGATLRGVIQEATKSKMRGWLEDQTGPATKDMTLLIAQCWI